MKRPSNDVLTEHFKQVSEETKIMLDQAEKDWEKYQEEQPLSVRLAVKLTPILKSHHLILGEIGLGTLVGIFTKNVGYGLSAGFFSYGALGLIGSATAHKARSFYTKKHEYLSLADTYQFRQNIYDIILGYLQNDMSTLEELYPFHLFLKFNCTDLIKNDDVLMADPYAAMVLDEIDESLNQHMSDLGGLLMATMIMMNPDMSFDSDDIIKPVMEVPFEDVTDQEDKPKTYKYGSLNE